MAYANYVTFTTPNYRLRCLVDTGAEVSLIKINKVEAQVNTHDTCVIHGVTEDDAGTGVTSIGSVDLQLYTENATLIQKFVVVPKELKLPFDALLGMDFLTNFGARIDFLNALLILQTPDEIQIPLQKGPYHNVFVIPPRSEVVRPFPSPVEHDSVIEKGEIARGVFVASAIISPTKSFLRVLNTTSEPKAINLEKISLSPLSEYDIVDINIKRNKNLKSLIESNTPDPYKTKMSNLCQGFADIFTVGNEEITTNNFYEQKLQLKDTEPVYSRNYRIPHAHKAIVNQKVDKMLQQGIVEPAVSPYNSPVLLVPKKSVDGKPDWRLVIDYRKVNEKVVKDKFPLPRIEEIFDQLGRAKFFSVVDLASGFHQIPLHKDSRDITAFSTDSGSYRFTRIPFGLSISCNSFCRMISMAFSGLDPGQCFIYVDDLIILGCSEKHHLKNIRRVFEVCRERNLKLNAMKCKWFQKEVAYLGHLCTENGLLPDPKKFDVVKNYPTPKNADETRRFVAFANYYRRFIKNFAGIVAPLNALTRKKETKGKNKIEFKWTDACQNAFDTLKQSLVEAPVLQYPDFEKQFVLYTDASDLACGAVLTQEVNGVHLPIAYSSRAFTKGERNKAVIEKELLAIYFAIKHFQPYLYGVRFQIYTDHRSLIFLYTMKDPTSRLTRIRLELEEYDFEIKYVKGKDNPVADALSRITIQELKELKSYQVQVLTRAQSKQKALEAAKALETNAQEETPRRENLVKPVVYETLNNLDKSHLPQLKFLLNRGKYLMIVCRKRQQILKVDLSRYIKINKLQLEAVFERLEREMTPYKINELALRKDDDIFEHFYYTTVVKYAEESFNKLKLVITQPIKLVDNEEEKKCILQEYHDSPIFGGHCGQTRLLYKIRSQYRWKGMTKDVRDYVRTCRKCQINKATAKHKPFSTLTFTPPEPFDEVTIDLIGPRPMSERGNAYALTMQCQLTKFVIISPIRDKEARTVAYALLHDLILVHGPVRVIRSDNGREFANEILTNLTEMLQIKHNRSVSFHPQSQAPLERNHGVLNNYLRMYVNESADNWDEYAKFYALFWNISPLTHLGGYTPFELVFNRKPKLTSILTDQIDPLYNVDDFVKLTKYRLQTANAAVKRFIDRLKIKQKENLDSGAQQLNIHQGDEILIERGNRDKSEKIFDGPFKVIDIKYPNIVISRENKEDTVHLDRVKLFKNRLE